MANANPIRIGQANLAGDARALFLKKFAGEVLTAFDETNVFLPKTMVRTIENGRSAQFPATWKGTAGYHTPGALLSGTQVAANERVIEIDDLLVADRFLANIDEAMNHYDFRSVISREMGQTLARAMDVNIARCVVRAARSTTNVTGGFGGTQIVNTTAGTDINAFIDSIFRAAQTLDEKDVPQGQRYLGVRPSEYYWLVSAGANRAIDRDVTSGANGGVDTGSIFRIAGFEIVPTNNLPRANVTTGLAKYQGDFSKTLAVAWHPMAVGTVKLLDLAMESDYQIERQGTLMVGKYSVGHDVLRPECAVEINLGAGNFRT